MRRFFLIALFLNFSSILAAQFQGADMWTRQISMNTIELNLKKYSRLSTTGTSLNIIVQWGDGSTDTITSSAYADFPVWDTREMVITMLHTYSSNGVYTIHVEEPNWTSGIINITASINQPFIGEVTVVVSSLATLNNFNGWINSQVYLYTGTGDFSFDLNYIESDGDSVVIEQQTVSQMPIPTLYRFPTALGCNEYMAGTTYHCDGITVVGEYTLSFQFKEYRDGTLMATHLREFIMRYSPGLGVFENYDQNVNLIYPNPAHDYLFLNSRILNGDAKLDISDLSGRIVKVFNLGSRGDFPKIDVSNLINGLYIVNVFDGNGIVASQRIVIAK